mmetsp:Transcript_26865/g.56362  ORF Transcript_26865/g.56362 Transcript_26865/m.56362 type:complete len:131 (-) Transcript_26865:182-574(-)
MTNASADSMPCALGSGRCCESKCNGEHVYHEKSEIKVTYSNCTVSENWEYQMVSYGLVKLADHRSSITDLPLASLKFPGPRSTFAKSGALLVPRKRGGRFRTSKIRTVMYTCISWRWQEERFLYTDSLID